MDSPKFGMWTVLISEIGRFEGQKLNGLLDEHKLDRNWTAINVDGHQILFTFRRTVHFRAAVHFEDNPLSSLGTVHFEACSFCVSSYCHRDP